MLTGRKLLLADDSAAIRKVIELTFSDEGMEVTTVPDGRAAFEKMGQVGPDLVLADVFMPEVGGYELCRSIKQDERFHKTPVVLLISSFEPFDEAEARRAGADDVVTKPFQSIRQLVSRVGSLLSKSNNGPENMDELVVPPIEHSEPFVPAPVAAPASEPVVIMEHQSEPQVSVFVEAPVMDHIEAAEPQGVACSTDIAMQTADTMRLEPISDESFEANAEDDLSLQDTIELKPVPPIAAEEPPPVMSEAVTEETSYNDMSEPQTEMTPAPRMRFDDAVLELEDEYLGEPQMVADDVFLDLDFGDSLPSEPAPVYVVEDAPAPVVFEPAVAVEPQEEELPQPVLLDEPVPVVVAPVVEEAVPVTLESSAGLSPAAIDAIARRVVEQMSEKVIREIAWEVVPELAELLIKQKLEEQK